MSRLLRLAPAWILVCTMLLASGSVMAVNEPPQGDLADELRFRRDFGFDTDPNLVQSMMRDPNAYRNWPVALTAEEEAELDRRVRMELEIGPLEAAAEMLPNFAGHWIDQPAGGTIVVAVTSDPEAARTSLMPLVPRGAALRTLTVPHSPAALTQLRDRIIGDDQQLRSAGIAIGHIGVDVSENAVKIGVVGLDDGKEAELRNRYGDAIVLVPANPSTTACTGRESCFGPPLRAGISAAPEGTSIGGRCSLAFLIHAGSAVGWLTAGHCAKTVSPQQTSSCPAVYCWNHAGQDGWEIGRIRKTCWPQCNFSDAARGGELNNTFSDNKVWQNNLGEMRIVASSQGFNADDEGDLTCLNARMRGNAMASCGYIDHIGRITYFNTPEGNVWFDEMRFATFANAFGDSGGAVHGYPTVVAYGIESGCTNMVNGVCQGLGVYSHIFRVLQEIGQGVSVSVCSSANPCP